MGLRSTKQQRNRKRLAKAMAAFGAEFAAPGPADQVPMPMHVVTRLADGTEVVVAAEFRILAGKQS